MYKPMPAECLKSIPLNLNHDYDKGRGATAETLFEPAWIGREARYDESRLGLVAVDYKLDLTALEFKDGATSATYNKIRLLSKANILCDHDVLMTQQGFETYQNALRHFLYFPVNGTTLNMLAYTARETVLQLIRNRQAEISADSGMNPRPGYYCVITKEPLFHLYRY